MTKEHFRTEKISVNFEPFLFVLGDSLNRQPNALQITLDCLLSKDQMNSLQRVLLLSRDLQKREEVYRGTFEQIGSKPGLNLIHNRVRV